MNTQNEEDIYKHLVPLGLDIKELMGFLLSHVWDGVERVNDNLAKKTIGKTVIKPSLNENADKYDSVRKTYPSNWVTTYMMKGTDDYALGITGSGSWHRSVGGTGLGEGKRLFISAIFLLRDISTNPPWMVQSWAYRDSDRGANTIEGLADIPDGIGYREENTGFHCKTIRTIRYKKLTYDIYTNGSEIRKIYNGATIPSGFTVIPKGALRGAWFANPTYTYDQLIKIEDYVNNVARTYSFTIG